MTNTFENILITNDIDLELQKIFEQHGFDKILILTDKNVEQHVLPLISSLKNLPTLTIPPGEQHKNLATATKIWEFLTQNKASRNSLLINLGGGVITDLGGFAASTFKRGIPFINIPTTLLSQIDAAIGGKTGINFQNYKNLIGTFTQPLYILINPLFLKTLPFEHFRAGFAEMIKHALLTSHTDWQLIKSFDLENIDYDFLKVLIQNSIKTKLHYVLQDPHEKNIRKALNFGHTIAHAIETYFLNKQKPILHGEAVAIGLIAEIYLSNQKFLFDFNKVLEISAFISKNFPPFDIPYQDYQQILDIMTQDKKNASGNVYFTLLKNIGEPQINQTCKKSNIIEALNFYRQISLR